MRFTGERSGVLLPRLLAACPFSFPRIGMPRCAREAHVRDSYGIPLCIAMTKSASRDSNLRFSPLHARTPRDDKRFARDSPGILSRSEKAPFEYDREENAQAIGKRGKIFNRLYYGCSNTF